MSASPGSQNSFLRSAVREPLLHFALIGIVLFAVHAWLNPDGSGGAGRERVRIDDGDVEWLAHAWSRQWQRQPQRDELQALVTAYLREELLAREALALGLDVGDSVVRRRLAQKVEFLVQDTVRRAEPSEDQLRRFHSENSERFLEPERLSFSHVYFDSAQRGQATADALSALAALAAGQAGAAHYGDPLLLEAEQSKVDELAVAARFGAEFARSVFALEPGAWHGPIQSGYGLHLVYVSARISSRRLDFAEARERVLGAWRRQESERREREYFAALLEKYDVVLDGAAGSLIGLSDLRLPDSTDAGSEDRTT
jgi:hypothetical protein